MKEGTNSLTCTVFYIYTHIHIFTHTQTHTSSSAIYIHTHCVYTYLLYTFKHTRACVFVCVLCVCARAHVIRFVLVYIIIHMYKCTQSPRTCARWVALALLDEVEQPTTYPTICHLDRPCCPGSGFKVKKVEGLGSQVLGFGSLGVRI
jgi:hypothetical protein